MRLLLDSNAYSLLMRGNVHVAELVHNAQELLFSADRHFEHVDGIVWVPVSPD